MQAMRGLPFTYRDYYGKCSTSVKIIITDIRNDEQKHVQMLNAHLWS